MQVCIVYFSRFGNNRISSEALGKYIREKGHTALVYSIVEVKAETLPTAELFIFGSPTRMGNPPGKVRRFMKRLKLPVESAPYSIVNTYSEESSKVIDKLAAILDDKGYISVHKGLMIKVLSLKGPLEDGYESKLAEFADACISAVS